METIIINPDYNIRIPQKIRKDILLNVGQKLEIDYDKKKKVIILKPLRSIVNETFGLWKTEKTGIEYVNELRDESEERIKELGID